MKIRFEKELTLVGGDLSEYVCEKLADAGIILEPERMYTPQLGMKEISLMKKGDDVSFEIPLEDADGNSGTVAVFASVMGRVFELSPDCGETTLVIYLLPTFVHGTGALESILPGDAGHHPRSTDHLYYLCPLDDKGRPHEKVHLVVEIGHVLVPGESVLVPDWKMEELIRDITSEGLEVRYHSLVNRKPTDGKYRLSVKEIVQDLSFRGTYVYVK